VTLLGALAPLPTRPRRSAAILAAAACFAPGLVRIAREAGAPRAGGRELELLLENDPNMICVVREETVVFANRALRERTGRTLAELRNKPPIRFVPAGGRRQAVETDFRDHRGLEVPVLLHAQPIEWRRTSAWRYELIDISEQRDAEREVREMMKELQRMNAELETSNRMQAEFPSNTSHELKTPLTRSSRTPRYWSTRCAVPSTRSNGGS
jgi:PAS domain-containing protein